MTSDPRLTAEQLRSSVQGTLDAFVAEQASILAGISADLVPFTDTLSNLLAGGKRLRPAFCMWGYLAPAAPTCPPRCAPPPRWRCCRPARWSTTT